MQTLPVTLRAPTLTGFLSLALSTWCTGCTTPPTSNGATDASTGESTTTSESTTDDDTTTSTSNGTSTTTDPTTTLSTSTTDGETTTGDPPLEPPGEEFAPARPQDQNPDATPDELATMADDERTFAVNLFKSLAPTGNAAISPTSLRIAFGMTYAGARTISEQEIQTALVYTPPKDRIPVAFNRIDLDLESRALPPSGEVDGDDSVQLSLVNQVFGRNNIDSWLPDFLDVLAVSYGSGLRLLDIAGDSEGSRLAINDWVNAVTHDRIPELLPSGSILPEVTTVLVNALYLKAPWAFPIDSVDEQGVFTRLDDSTVQAAMMHVEHREARHFKGAGVEALEIPLRGNQLALVVLLPDPGTFAQYVSGLDGAALGEVFAGLKSLEANVTLPRFTATADLALKNALTPLGIVSSWNLGGGDFSGIAAGAGGWAISDVYHDVFVAVDEKGVEAAAASAVVIYDTGDPGFNPEVDFVADRPFLFAIRDRGTDSLLFFGQVLDPSE